MMASGFVVDDAAWRAAVDKWMVLARAVGQRGSNEAANAVKDETARLASIFIHPRHTKTPSPPGAPVGRISGDLVHSLLVTPRGGMITDVGPTIRYGRIQELGGYSGGWWPGRLPARPYLLPGTAMKIADG